MGTVVAVATVAVLMFVLVVVATLVAAIAVAAVAATTLVRDDWRLLMQILSPPAPTTSPDLPRISLASSAAARSCSLLSSAAARTVCSASSETC